METIQLAASLLRVLINLFFSEYTFFQVQPILSGVLAGGGGRQLDSRYCTINYGLKTAQGGWEAFLHSTARAPGRGLSYESAWSWALFGGPEKRVDKPTPGRRGKVGLVPHSPAPELGVAPSPTRSRPRTSVAGENPSSQTYVPSQPHRVPLPSELRPSAA